MINVKTHEGNTKSDDCLLSSKILTFPWNQIESLFNTQTKKVTAAQLHSFGYEFHLLCHYLLKPFLEAA